MNIQTDVSHYVYGNRQKLLQMSYKSYLLFALQPLKKQFYIIFIKSHGILLILAFV